MKISIVIPLFDRRDAGWQALQSALVQRYPRERFEVVAVTARDDAETRDPVVAALLARCDSVVRTDLDGAFTTNEIQLYLAGYRRSTGGLMFFCEGHTVLHDRSCALIDEHFRRHPDCEMAWAPRLNHAVSPLGTLVAMHNERHQRRALAAGVFSLGANSVIRRTMLDALGGWTRAICASARRRCFIARSDGGPSSVGFARRWQRTTTTWRRRCGAGSRGTPGPAALPTTTTCSRKATGMTPESGIRSTGTRDARGSPPCSLRCCGRRGSPCFGPRCVRCASSAGSPIAAMCWRCVAPTWQAIAGPARRTQRDAAGGWTPRAHCPAP